MLLVHLHTFPELYCYEKQRYLSSPYQKELFLTKNSIQSRRFVRRYQNALTECGTVPSSNPIPMKIVKRSNIKVFLMLLNLPSLMAYRVLDSIKYCNK